MAALQDGQDAASGMLQGLPSRPHNSVVWDLATGMVRKSSHDKVKIRDEVRWLTSLGSDSWMVPRVLMARELEGSSAYVMEHVPLPTVSQLLLAPSPRAEFWEEFFECLSLFCAALHQPAPLEWDFPRCRAACHQVYVSKTVSRLEEAAVVLPRSVWDGPLRVNGRALPCVKQVLSSLNESVALSGLLSPPWFSRVHGDLCLGNMFFDAPSSRIAVIDPRGSFGEPGLFGDPVYDLAKLSHSFRGGYDALLAGRYSLSGDLATFEVDTPHETSEMFSRWLEAVAPTYQVPVERVTAAEVLLFLSMVPLHSDDPARQVALTLRGLSLWDEVGL